MPVKDEQYGWVLRDSLGLCYIVSADGCKHRWYSSKRPFPATGQFVRFIPKQHEFYPHKPGMAFERRAESVVAITETALRLRALTTVITQWTPEVSNRPAGTQALSWLRIWRRTALPLAGQTAAWSAQFRGKKVAPRAAKLALMAWVAAHGFSADLAPLVQRTADDWSWSDTRLLACLVAPSQIPPHLLLQGLIRGFRPDGSVLTQEVVMAWVKAFGAMAPAEREEYRRGLPYDFWEQAAAIVTVPRFVSAGGPWEYLRTPLLRTALPELEAVSLGGESLSAMQARALEPFPELMAGLPTAVLGQFGLEALGHSLVAYTKGQGSSAVSRTHRRYALLEYLRTLEQDMIPQAIADALALPAAVAKLVFKGLLSSGAEAEALKLWNGHAEMQSDLEAHLLHTLLQFRRDPRMTLDDFFGELIKAACRHFAARGTHKKIMTSVFPACDLQRKAFSVHHDLFCEATLGQRATHYATAWWCRREPCPHPHVQPDLRRPYYTRNAFDWIAALQVPYLQKVPAQQNPVQFPSKLAGWYNRMNEVRSHMHCHRCGSIIAPDLAYSRPSVNACYQVTTFYCQNCADEKKIYLNHCIKCFGIIDSRIHTERCPNGMYICKCGGCCDREHVTDVW